jgi:hypothetical protein
MQNMELDIRFNKLTRITLVFLLIFQFSACKKSEQRKCFKTIGSEISKTIDLPSFNKLLLKEHIEYVLIQDSTDKLVIRGGENVVNFIEFKLVEDNRIKIENKNKCSFLRKLNAKIIVEIHYTEINDIHFEGTESLTNVGTLKGSYLSLLIRDGAGSVKLNIDTPLTFADISHGWGDYTFTGKTEYAEIRARSNGYCDVLGLEVSDSIFTSNSTAGTIKLKADGIALRGEILTNGKIVYRGTPSLIDVKITGTGKLVAE